jgi:hypothetical protein
MKLKFLLFNICIMLIYTVSFSQEVPKIGFEELMINAEMDHLNVIQARKEALKKKIPLSIYLEEGIHIEAKGIENDKPVYAVIKNILHPFENGSVMFYEEIAESFNLEGARINYGNGVILNPDVGLNEVHQNNISNRAANYLLVAESGSNSVLLLDFLTGDLVNPNFIPPQSNLSVAKQARHSPRGTISISDQTEDVVFDYDTSGTLISVFAPNIGPHNGILDNIRGHNYRPENNNLVVCNAQGGNFNRIVEFDTLGNYIGIFIQSNSGGLLSPFDIYFRANDVLVTGSTSSAAHRYDLNGNYLDNFAIYISFPQQIVEFPNGNVGIASFGTSGGLFIYDQNGILLNNFTSVSGLRGVHYLGNGNIIVTNSSGVYELNGATGAIERTIVAGVNAQYVSPCDLFLDATPVELAAFHAFSAGSSVNLEWVTSSELNNYGFEIERFSEAEVNKDWKLIGFVEGKGTTTEAVSYSYSDKNLASGLYKYRLKQIDYDGSPTYSHEIEVEVNSLPVEFKLYQNYPNPFNPVTTINYSIPEPGDVSLKIYNVLGKEIQTLLYEFKEAGNHNISFDASHLSSGVYFYQIKSANYGQTKKLILNK